MAERIDTRELCDERDSIDALEESELTGAEIARRLKIDALESDIGDEFRHGVTMIPEDDFEEYAREFAEGVGAIDEEARWPYTCIDWEYAARELAHDFSLVTFDGEDYYVPSN